jgi:homoserine O-succinyltransferase/O-acetyltransferase
MTCLTLGDLTSGYANNPVKADIDTAAAVEGYHGRTIVVGLVNNMPDAALEATEAQFRSLLQSAAGDLPIHLRLTYLPEIRRGEAATGHLNRHYCTLDTFLKEPPDAIIVTGTEPIASELSDEPYWHTFGQLVDWAEAHTVSSIWSCLAAHAAVQHLSDIRRHRLPHKCCGVFENQMLAAHLLTDGIASPLLTPHSRWNESPPEALSTAGYTIVSAGTLTGANIFIRQAGSSLMVFFQGHPEYEDTTLLKEYRRDIGRFLRGQQPRYPGMPQGYFAPGAIELLNDFRERAETQRDPRLMAEFPAGAQESLSNSWRSSAVALYANWLGLLRATP